MYPNEVHATVAIVSFKKRKGVGPKHNGVCSTWLNRIDLGCKVPCVIRQAHAFHLPDDPRTPVIMVGPGTGIAPYRSFWQERIYKQNESLKTNLNQPSPDSPQVKSKTFNLNNPSGGRRRRKTEFEPPKLSLLQAPGPSGEDTPDSGNTGSNSVCCFPMKRSLSDTDDSEVMARLLAAKHKLWGDMTLFFGCRRNDLDYIYKDELMRAKVTGALTDVHVGFSRDPKKPKTYVQHLLKNHASKIVKQLMEERGHFYVCGDISMAADVCRTLQSIFEENAAMSGDEARRLIESMKDQGVYHEDIFGVTLKHQEVTTRVRHAAKNWRILVTSDSSNPLQTPMTPGVTPGLRLPSPMLGTRSFGSKFESPSSSSSSYESATMPSRQRTPIKRPTVTVLLPTALTPPDTTARAFTAPSMRGKASLQAGMSIDDSLLSKSAMKLITIEEPQKAILEPVSEVSESPATPISPPAVQFSLVGQPIQEPHIPSQVSESKRPSISKSRHAVIAPPSPELAVKKQPVERKKSEDKKVKRIRTNSKVETAL